MSFMNVREKWFMYDTVMISAYVDSLSHPIPGWYPSFAAMSQVDEISFFNQRNRSIGIAYNNQDARDQVPFALVAESISVNFYACACSSQYGALSGTNTHRGRTDVVSTFFENEVPQHCSAIFRTNQDERLKINTAMIPASTRPIGYSMGQGDTVEFFGSSASVTAGGMGKPELKYRWEFGADGIGIPRRATLSVSLRWVEWLRDVFSRLWGPGYIKFWNEVAAQPAPTHAEVFLPSAFLIQCLITGSRQVQQRGEYHA